MNLRIYGKPLQDPRRNESENDRDRHCHVRLACVAGKTSARAHTRADKKWQWRLQKRAEGAALLGLHVPDAVPVVGRRRVLEVIAPLYIDGGRYVVRLGFKRFSKRFERHIPLTLAVVF